MKHYHIVALLCATFLLSSLPMSGEQVRVTVESQTAEGEMTPIWAWFGYDEPNYTYMKDGSELLTRLSHLSPVPVNIRVHNLLTSGDGTPALKWGSTNAYTEDENGNPVYDWKLTDSIFDTFVSRGMKPLVQIGFMPEALSVSPEPYRHSWRPGDDYSDIFTGWAYPPSDYDKWRDLVYNWALHCRERYGAEEASSWYWEVWNEPNLYLQGTLEDYCRMYDYAVDGLLDALPAATVGGPHSTGPRDRRAAEYLKGFIEHCLYGTNYATGKHGTPLRYVGFHAKGGPRFSNGVVTMGIAGQLRDVECGFEIIGSYPELSGIPVIIGEFDPEGCAACSTDVYPDFDYRNGTIYSSTVAATYARLYALSHKYSINLKGAVTWAFEFENQPLFRGFRDLYTNGIDKAVLNVFRMFGMMGGNLVRARSSSMVPLDSICRRGVRRNADVGVLASRNGDEIAVMLWNYHDVDSAVSTAADISLKVGGVGLDRCLVTRYVVDPTVGNAYREWIEMGKPDHPDSAQISRLTEASRIALAENPKWLTPRDNSLRLNFQLARQGVTLIIIRPLEQPAVKVVSNNPSGVGKGIFPGRVVWTRNADVTQWNGHDGHWWDEGNIDTDTLAAMFSKSLNVLAGGKNTKQSWKRLFSYFNKSHDRGDRGYKKGETIAVKVNLNNTYSRDDRDNDIDQSPQMTVALLDELVNNAGVPQECIVIYDATEGWKTRTIPDRLYEPVNKLYPGVKWMCSKGREGIESADWVDNAITYTSDEVKLGNSLPRRVIEADYIINVALLKGHEMTGVTLGAKNHFGSIMFPQLQHSSPTVSQFSGVSGSYSALVDLMGSENLGRKTLLYIVDGLYAMQTNVGAPSESRDKWTKLFGNEWCASLLMSLDPVAIECVGLDLLTAQYGSDLGFSGAPQFGKGAVRNSDNYLKEAASGVNRILGPYRPDGKECGSLGVYERWDSPVTRRYSLNLGKSEGIELIEIR